MTALPELDRAEPAGNHAIVYRDVMIPMRDGVRLATDIYMPRGSDGATPDKPLPVILERTPYDKAGTSRSERSRDAPEPMSRVDCATHLVAHGYIVIWQDCRGRYGSEGAFTKYLAEGEDGYDTMAWIVDQPWCNGKIGTMGLSYGAHTQMALACLNPPGLACMIVDSGGFSNAFTCGIRQGGAFELKQATWAYDRAGESALALRQPEIARAIEAEDLAAWFKHMPWTKGRSPVRWHPEYESYLLEQWQHGTFDDFWKRLGIYAAGYYDTFPKVPIAFMSSWYDAYVQTTFENYDGLSGDRERPLHLIMGPWTHGDRSEQVFGDVNFGPDAPFDGQLADTWLDWRIAFFDRWLKGKGASGSHPVSLFVMGGGSGAKTSEGHLDHGGTWLHAEAWPLPRLEPLVLFPTAQMSLEHTPGPAAEITYAFDPENPVPTIGGALTSGGVIFEGGGFDQVEQEGFFGCDNPGLPLNARKDVISFQTEPLEKALTVIGPIEIVLQVATDAPDTDFTAKLIDVYPPSECYPRGYALGLSDGIFRVRYRHGFDAPALVDGTDPFIITIRPFATANRFEVGHRIRLDISSSNFPKYDVNPNTGAPEGTSRHCRIALNSVFVGETSETALKLNVLQMSGA
ncbi:MAG: CocE/NonD family hydrolase [Pseudomonadota bacterium]